MVSAASVLVAAGVVGIVTVASAPTGTVDMRGHHVVLEPGTVPAPAVEKKMDAVVNTGVRFTVPSVGLNVPLGELSEAGGTITPPGFTAAYRVRNLGVPLANATKGTVFVAMHSIRGGGIGPGNYLIDVSAGAAKVSDGAKIHVGSLTYSVTGSQTVTKNQLPKDAAVWANAPGRLVAITCLQTPAQTASTDNVVITAQLDN